MDNRAATVSRYLPGLRSYIHTADLPRPTHRPSPRQCRHWVTRRRPSFSDRWIAMTSATPDTLSRCRTPIQTEQPTPIHFPSPQWASPLAFWTESHSRTRLPAVHRSDFGDPGFKPLWVRNRETGRHTEHSTAPWRQSVSLAVLAVCKWRNVPRKTANLCPRLTEACHTMGSL